MHAPDQPSETPSKAYRVHVAQIFRISLTTNVWWASLFKVAVEISSYSTCHKLLALVSKKPFQAPSINDTPANNGQSSKSKTPPGFGFSGRE